MLAGSRRHAPDALAQKASRQGSVLVYAILWLEHQADRRKTTAQTSSPDWRPTKEFQGKGMKILVLLPFILLVRLAARCDPHLFRYWDVRSLRTWREGRLTWGAWAIAAAGWAILACTLGVIYLLVRRRI